MQDYVRPLGEFINCAWTSRNAPCFSLSREEVRLLASKTFKGSIYRLVMRLVRGNRLWTIPPAPELQPEEDDTAPSSPMNEPPVVHKLPFTLNRAMPAPAEGGHEEQLVNLNRQFHTPCQPPKKKAPKKRDYVRRVVRSRKTK